MDDEALEALFVPNPRKSKIFPKFTSRGQPAGFIGAFNIDYFAVNHAIHPS
jgi:hypothetical protein